MQILLFLFVSLLVNTHELHLSMCTLTYNDEANRIELQQRIFYDDLERSLRIRLKDDRFDILSPDNSSINYDSLFNEYMNQHVDLYVNGDPAELELLEYEISDDAIVLYMYKANVAELKSLDIFSHVLFELFNDQDNVITIQANGKKKSQKFSISSKPLEILY